MVKNFSQLCLKVSFVLAFTLVAATISSTGVKQKLDAVLPWLQALAFSTTTVNQGMQATKQLGDSKK
ncbi:MAG: hypothetical protein F6K65_06490 [Moorea sp. SIO3C2]|nr:hypothetical protein [Moorena sp. SIO3C2]